QRRSLTLPLSLFQRVPAPIGIGTPRRFTVHQCIRSLIAIRAASAPAIIAPLKPPAPAKDEARYTPEIGVFGERGTPERIPCSYGIGAKPVIAPLGVFRTLGCPKRPPLRFWRVPRPEGVKSR